MGRVLDLDVGVVALRLHGDARVLSEERVAMVPGEAWEGDAGHADLQVEGGACLELQPILQGALVGQLRGCKIGKEKKW